MPIKRGYTTRDGERVGFFQWNPPDGKRYFYEPGNERSRAQAKSLAEKQRQAAFASGYEG